VHYVFVHKSYKSISSGSHLHRFKLLFYGRKLAKSGYIYL